MPFEDLSDDNFLLYAVKVYISPHCVKSEFKEDLNRIRYVRRLLKTYNKTGELKHRQILNHLIVSYNVFGIHTTRLLFFVMTEDEFPALKTFLLYLNKMPETVKGIRGKNINSAEIQIDLTIANLLRKTYGFEAIKNT